MEITHSIFPIPIFQTNLDVPPFIIDYLKDQKLNRIPNGYMGEKNILDHPSMQRAKTFLMRKVNTFFYNICGHSDDVYLDMVCSWINLHKTGDFAHTHIHMNSVVSGVWYISTTEKTGQISFMRDSFLFGNSIQFEIESINAFNQDSFNFSPVSGDIIIFPSILKHWVAPNLDDCDRVSIAFNCIARGTMKTESVPYTI
jgi:uncharacterized protein (TIGR02466 family)